MNPDSVRLVFARLAKTAGIVGSALEQISPSRVARRLHHDRLRQTACPTSASWSTPASAAWRPCAATSGVVASTVTAKPEMSASSGAGACTYRRKRRVPTTRRHAARHRSYPLATIHDLLGAHAKSDGPNHDKKSSDASEA